MMANFTKGQWKHQEDGVIIAEDGKQIASVFPRDRLANAHLIAASPRMAQLLEKLVSQDGWMFAEDIKEAKEILQTIA